MAEYHALVLCITYMCEKCSFFMVIMTIYKYNIYDWFVCYELHTLHNILSATYHILKSFTLDVSPTWWHAYTAVLALGFFHIESLYAILFKKTESQLFLLLPKPNSNFPAKIFMSGHVIKGKVAAMTPCTSQVWKQICDESSQFVDKLRRIVIKYRWISIRRGVFYHR